MVLVPKPDGKVQLCVDYRRLNAITKPDVYPLARLDELLHSTGNAHYISTMDLRSGYYQITIFPDDCDKTAVITPFGVYRFKRMPFGLRNAPATFQRLMDRFKVRLSGLKLLVYLDDLILLSETYEAHFNELQACFNQLRIFKLRMNRPKCSFGCQRVRYLGHVISPEGIETNPEKVAAISRMEPPINVKQLLTFLQTCNWYRRFIPNFAGKARPLTCLTKKDAAWEWGPAQSAAFEGLKKALTTAPVLRQASPSECYTLRSDASSYALGAALMQGEGINEQLIEYASRLLTAPERNYSTTEREALALVWAVNKFRGYLEEAPAIVVTDHQLLRWLMSLKSPSGRLARWSLQFQPYNLTIEYSPGKANVVADTLSRPPGVQSTEECHIGLISIEMPREKPEILRQKQLEDPEVKKIVDAYEHEDVHVRNLPL